MRTPRGLDWGQWVAVDEVPVVGDGAAIALFRTGTPHGQTRSGIDKDPAKCWKAESLTGALNVNYWSRDNANIQFNFHL